MRGTVVANRKPLRAIVTEDLSMAANAQTPKSLRVLIVAPSFDILGGQSVQAARLADCLREEPSLQVGFLPINPRLPGPLRYLQRIKYVRTILTTIAYVISLLLRVYKYDVIHVFSASYFSFVIAPTPAILSENFTGERFCSITTVARPKITYSVGDAVPFPLSNLPAP